MRLITIWDKNDVELMVDMDLKRPVAEPHPAAYFRAWMSERIKWGLPFLVVAAVITAVSIITMIAKHI